MASALGLHNPLRYRGYVYDTETGLYYLQSRYYDPNLGRFINADALVSTGQGLLGNNMFAYCLNNPVAYSDSLGSSCQISLTQFDPTGYSRIVDQSAAPWGEMPLGSSTVGEMGCGLVAIYNAMIALGDYREFSEICYFFDSYPTGHTDHGRNGLFVLDVAAYFLSEGYHAVVLTSLTEDLFALYSEHADACIMLYQYGSVLSPTGHYVEYNACAGGYIGVNTSEGNGVYSFSSPASYGLKDSRFFFYGIFVFDPDR